MNLLLLLGIGAAVYVLTSSKSKPTSPSTTKEEKPLFEAKEVNVASSEESSKSLGSKVGGIKTSNCNEFQYKQGETCITFWTPQIEETIKVKVLGKADQIRKNILLNAIGLDKPVIAPEVLLCQNDTKNEIIKSSILEVYQNIKAEDLPPNKDKPLWIRRVWDLSMEVYNKHICP